jgi:Rrf2 family iron-sulfur cluster assembly transcriptional regulator
MISLSVTTGYAIKALTCLESGDCVPRHISDIARCTGVPRAYLAKILNALAQQGLVQTKRGYSGGISLARPAEDISLLQIVEAVEGKEWIAECLLGMDDCGRHTDCPVHDAWARIREELAAELGATSLASVMISKPNRHRHAQARGLSQPARRCACFPTLHT